MGGVEGAAGGVEVAEDVVRGDAAPEAVDAEALGPGRGELGARGDVVEDGLAERPVEERGDAVLELGEVPVAAAVRALDGAKGRVGVRGEGQLERGAAERGAVELAVGAREAGRERAGRVARVRAPREVGVPERAHGGGDCELRAAERDEVHVVREPERAVVHVQAQRVRRRHVHHAVHPQHQWRVRRVRAFQHHKFIFLFLLFLLLLLVLFLSRRR